MFPFIYALREKYNSNLQRGRVVRVLCPGLFTHTGAGWYLGETKGQKALERQTKRGNVLLWGLSNLQWQRLPSPVSVWPRTMS